MGDPPGNFQRRNLLTFCQSQRCSEWVRKDSGQLFRSVRSGSFAPPCNASPRASAATPQNLLGNLKSADLFHFSGHASSEAQSSYLLTPSTGTSKATLDADALDSLDLHRCKLAVLAACNTTASDPAHVEPSPDLRNALLRSGVHAVVASSWDVDDRATGALMLVFYKQLTQGTSSAHSLQLAQMSVQSEMSWQHPYYWASFQLFAN